MASTHNILVAFDFRPESAAALDYAIIVGEKINAVVHLLFVLDEETPLLRMVLTDKQRQLMARGAEEKLDDVIKEKSSGTKIPIKGIVKKGKVYQQIVKTAKENKVHLIMMGRTSSTDIVKNFTGTNTIHIVRESDIPVITLKKITERPGCNHILLPLDLTKQTKKQVCRAISVAGMLKAGITIITVLAVDSASLKIKFSTRLREIKDIFDSYNLPCEYKLIYNPDPVWSKLLKKLSKELHSDLVMIMTQQELDFTEYFIGSTAQEIINNSDLPVLSLTPDKEGPVILPDDMMDALINPIKILDY